MSTHSPLAMKLDVSPASRSSCRSMPELSYVHEPNFMSQFCSSNGNHVMSILHVLRNSPGGTHRQSPLDDTTTFVGYLLSKSLSALTRNINQSINVMTIRRLCWASMSVSLLKTAYHFNNNFQYHIQMNQQITVVRVNLSYTSADLFFNSYAIRYISNQNLRFFL